MASTLLVAINAKHTHTNLAVRSLCSALREAGIAADFAEYTINQPLRQILSELCERAPARLLFSCYIWNIDAVRALGADYRLLHPEAQILLGGPEVSYGAEKLLAGMPWADAIVCGEGERLLPQVLAEERPRGAYQATECVSLDALAFPYDDLSALQNRVLYYESTRGCPFGCEYCLSSADTRVRARSLPLVYQDLQRILDARAMKVKFVDRTFNLNPERAAAIWRYLIAHDNGVTSFQMELGGDLTTPEQLALLQTARVGLFQFEIGVQSTNPETLRMVARSTDLDRLRANVEAVRRAGNIHQHLDLIAGLPGEDYATFARSFDDVFAMRPEQIQLGFLKLLRGSTLYERREALGLLCSVRPPYEVLRTPSISFAELSKLKRVADATELYYNSGRFTRQLDALLERYASPFAAFLDLSDGLAGLSQYDAYDHLYEQALRRGCDAMRMAWRMRLDLCLHERPRRLPKHCAMGVSLAERKRLLSAEAHDGTYADLFPAWALGLDGDDLRAVRFDYARRDPWGHVSMALL